MKKIPKKWRELSKEERFKIPNKYFDIDKKTINRIRNIADTKKRLIEAAKIQYELFNDIHSYLTVWIAGYGSDVIIRKKFGSTQELLNLFFKPINYPKNIEPSWQDIKRRIKIPGEMTEKLAEETGIHIGDGNLNVYQEKNGFKSYRYGISGDLINEYIYHKEYIANLIKKIYNLKPNHLEREQKGNIETYLKSKLIVQYKNKILGLRIGSKKEIKIPTQILNNKEFEKRCVIGIIDTDFNITSSLAISGKMNNLFVIKEIKEILKKNNIPFICKLYQNYGRFYIGKKGAIKIIEDWGLKNEKHISKYNFYKEFKKFIPFSTTPERLAVLNGKLDIEELEKISEKRRVSMGGCPTFPV